MSPVRFIILMTPRTGSSALVNGLSKHPHITCLSEIFFKQSFFLFGKSLPIQNFPKPLQFLLEKIKISLPFLYIFFAFNRFSSKKCTGFKIQLWQIQKYQLENLFKSLSEQGVTFFLLERDDKQAQAMSLLRANETNLWHSHKQTSLKDVEFSDEQIEKTEKRMRERAGELSDFASHLGAIELSYEKHILTLDAFTVVQKALGLPYSRLKSDLVRIGSYRKKSIGTAN